MENIDFLKMTIGISKQEIIQMCLIIGVISAIVVVIVIALSD